MKEISWQEYVEIISLLVLIYYVVVFFLYFRGDILQLARQGFWKHVRIPTISKERIVSQAAKTTEKSDDNHTLFSSVHELMEELKSLFDTATQKHLQKHELMMALQLKLNDYHQLKTTSFQVAINNHIMHQSLVQCDITITDIEIKQLW